MKIIYFAAYYEPYLDFFYKKYSELATKTYQEQLTALENDAFGAFWSYAQEATRQGHEGHLIIANCKPLQMAWAKENNIIFDEKNWQFSIPVLQTKKIMPDVFFIGSMFQYYGEFLDEIKKYSKKIFGWISCPMPDNLFQKTHPELILSSAPHYVEDFRKHGINSELMTAFFDENTLNLIAQKETDKIISQKYDFTFLGGITHAHTQRTEAINKLVQKTPIQLFGYGYQNFPDTRNRVIRRLFKHPVQKRYQGEAWGLDMYNVLYNSKITFNSHIDMANGAGVNMRMYEATGMGTLLLTDGKGKNELFEDGKEVVYYENLNDAIEKANYYLNPKNEEERLKIAKAGQKRTLTEYNIQKTIAKMLAYFEKYI